HRPGHQDAVPLQSEVVVQAGGVVALDDERIALRTGPPARRLGRAFEVAHLQVLAELGVARPGDGILAPGGGAGSPARRTAGGLAPAGAEALRFSRGVLLPTLHADRLQGPGEILAVLETPPE